MNRSSSLSHRKRTKLFPDISHTKRPSRMAEALCAADQADPTLSHSPPGKNESRPPHTPGSGTHRHPPRRCSHWQRTGQALWPAPPPACSPPGYSPECAGSARETGRDAGSPETGVVGEQGDFAVRKRVDQALELCTVPRNRIILSASSSA